MQDKIYECINDMLHAAERGRLSVEEQVRAYDILDELLASEGNLPESDGFLCAAEKLCSVYSEVTEALETAYDEATLKSEIQERLRALEDKKNDARFEAAAAASLHEFAKEVHEIWQTSGIFARRRALKELRERAGFRLESHRIGNYVAKTFDLMNEAQARFAAAQQLVFASDVTYKVKPGIHGRIAETLSSSPKG